MCSRRIGPMLPGKVRRFRRHGYVGARQTPGHLDPVTACAVVDDHSTFRRHRYAVEQAAFTKMKRFGFVLAQVYRDLALRIFQVAAHMRCDIDRCTCTRPGSGQAKAAPFVLDVILFVPRQIGDVNHAAADAFDYLQISGRLEIFSDRIP